MKIRIGKHKIPLNLDELDKLTVKDIFFQLTGINGFICWKDPIDNSGPNHGDLATEISKELFRKVSKILCPGKQYDPS